MAIINMELQAKEFVLFSLGSCSMWSGRAKLHEDDLGAAAGRLPPAAVASLGSKRLIPRDELKKLEGVKRSMQRELASRGIRMLGGYAVANSLVEEAVRELNLLVKKGQALTDNLMQRFDSIVEDWWAENPEWRHILQAGTPEKEYIRNRIRFEWDAHMIQLPENDELASKLRVSIGLMGPNLFKEIEKEASEFVAKSLKSDRNTASQRTLAPLRRMAKKIGSFAMLDHLAAPIGQICQAVLSSMPAAGKVSEENYLRLIRLAYMMSHIAELRGVAQEVHDGLSVDAAVERIFGSTSASSLDFGDGARAHVVDPSPDELNVALFDDEFGVATASPDGGSPVQSYVDY